MDLKKLLLNLVIPIHYQEKILSVWVSNCYASGYVLKGLA